MEKKIIINLDDSGKISAETEGIHGETCLDELQQLMEELDEIHQIEKTDDYFKQPNVKPTIKKDNQQKLKS